MKIGKLEKALTVDEPVNEEKEIQIHVLDEVERFFDDSSLSNGVPPELILLIGSVAVGKTTIRKQQYSTGFVVLDAAEIFLNLSRGEFFPFPKAFQEPMEVIGILVAQRAIAERRHIVIELVGRDIAEVKELIDSMLAIGYRFSIQAVICDLEQAIQRNQNRGDDAISAYYAEPFQRRWLLDAAKGALAGGDAESQ